MARARAARGRGHLGDRTAAFVDGQLTGPERAAALRHLEGCDLCAVSVRAQRLLKWRMSGLAATPVAPPASLLGRLTDLGDRLGEAAVPDWTSPVPERRRRAVPRALLAGGLTVLAVCGAYVLAPGTSPVGTAPPLTPAGPAVDRSPLLPVAVRSAPDVGVVRAQAVARTLGSSVLGAAVAMEPTRAASRNRSAATRLPAGAPTAVR